LLAKIGHGSGVSLGSDALLNQVSVLIVENEPFIALDLATAVEEARGKVIGPPEACVRLFCSLNTTWCKQLSLT
jgi:hypothetical protein